jgi:hypothetical protein
MTALLIFAGFSILATAIFCCLSKINAGGL